MTDKRRSLAEAVLAHCRAHDLMLATAESCTGGMVSAALTDVSGSSHYFDRGFVTYSNVAKQEMLAVKSATLTEFGAVSEQVAAEMAQGAIEHSRANIAIAVTGIAGPGGSENKPEGRVCFGLARAGHSPVTKTVEFGAIGRENVRLRTTETALRLILEN